MFIDYANSDTPNDIECDICIIGAGPAGITLAQQLASSGRSIVLLESGGTEAESATQALSTGESTGFNYYPLNATRIRALGGSTVHWSGWCGPMNDIDFTKRDWIPHSGWPISLSDLAGHYEKAQEYCQLGRFAYSAQDWSDDFSDLPDFESDNLLSRIWQFSSPPLNFGKAYQQALEKQKELIVYTHANVTKLNLDPGGLQILSANLQTLDGKTGLLKAGQFVLSCGGIENPRLLLASNDVNQQGVGNDRDLVGRFFMEHNEADSATLTGFDAKQMREFKRLKSKSEQEIGVAFCTPESKQRELKIGNGGAFIAAPDLGRKNGWTATHAFLDALLQVKPPKNFLENLNQFFTDFDTAAGVFALRVRGKSTDTRILEKRSINIISMAEQVPNPDSRVTLSSNKDLFGNPQANLNWQVTDFDKRTIRSTMELLATEMSRLNIGRVKIEEWLQEGSGSNWSPTLRGGHHHMGTTRMADDPAAGVVDKNCKVHGIENLYVAGSSVFPTGGYVNPTLTIVALSVRLADHLKSTKS